MKTWIRNEARLVMISCDSCKREIGTDDCYDCNLSRKYAGLNSGTHECSYCKKKREREYDDFVDPLHFYH